MLPTKETTALDVWTHALNHGDRPVIHGVELDYDDIHDGVHLHADLLEAAEKQVNVTLAAAEKSSRDMDQAARNVAITVDLAEKDGRSPRGWSTYRDDLAAYRAADEASKAAHAAFLAAVERRDVLRAKRDQDAAMATYEVSA